MLKAPKLLREEILLEKFGKKVVSRFFDVNGREEEFVCWGGAKGRISTMIFPLTINQEIIIIRQFRYAANQFILEIPGGNPKTNETPKEVAQAELLEETGYQAENFIEIPVGFFFEPFASLGPSYKVVIAVGCKKVAEPKPDSTEVLETLIIPLAEWVGMIRRGEITDSKSITITFLALLYLGAKITLNGMPLF